MRLFVVLIAACAFFGCGSTQEQNIDAMINEIFRNNSGGGNSGNINVGGTAANSGSSPEPEEDCTCVQYYLCDQNNSIITDGVGVIDIRVNVGGCPSYLEVCCKNPKMVDIKEPITPKPPVNKPTGCGRRNPDGVGFRITGDQDHEAQFAEFPWMVAILREEMVEGNPIKLNIYQCGGALIHPSVVLTAAHCIAGADKPYKIRAGEWDTQTMNEILPHQDRHVKQVVIHQGYYNKALFNDIALLFLEQPVELAGNVDIICLPPQDMLFDGSRCTACGWGKNVFGREGKYQVILKKIELPVVNRAECLASLRTTRLGKHFQLDKSFLCAGGEAGKDTCRGDGGSPLMCTVPGQPDRYVQVGIVAWGIGCSEQHIPGVYVNVPLFRNWIDDQMRTHGYDVTTYSY